jgi:hypothetical protein
MHISLDKIRIDCGTQSRKEIDWVVVDDYAEKMLAGEVFPQATAFYDGTYYYLGDGFHRFHANQKVGAPSMDCNVIEGSLRDAILFSYGANAKHGKPRTNADKIYIVTNMLNDFEWSGWSDREIARQCEVSHTFVAKIRNQLNQGSDDAVGNEERKFERDGKVHKMEAKILKDKKLSKDHVATLPDAEMETDVEKEELFDAVDLLKAENQALTDQLAVISVSPEQAERDMTESLIAELRSKIKFLEIELASARQSRDTYQSEKAQLMKQNATLQKKLKQYEESK